MPHAGMSAIKPLSLVLTSLDFIGAGMVLWDDRCRPRVGLSPSIKEIVGADRQ